MKYYSFNYCYFTKKMYLSRYKDVISKSIARSEEEYL